MAKHTEQTQAPTPDRIPTFESDWMQYKQYVDDGDNFTLAMFTGEPTIDTGEGSEDMWDISLAKDLVDLHDGKNRQDEFRQPLPDVATPPTVIFVTASRGIPFGFAVKSFWKEAYPNEKTPQIKVIDPSRQRFNHGASDELRKRVNQEEIDKLRAVGEQLGFNNVALFEEIVNGGHTMKLGASLLAKAGFKDVACIFGSVGEIFAGMLRNEELPLYRQAAYDKYLNLGGSSEDVRKLVWNAGEKSRAFIRDMKLVGHLMAEEAKRRGVIPPHI